MEVQTCNCFSAAARRYVEELLPLLATIHSPIACSSSSSLTIADKAKLVKQAADTCLAKAAGADAIWGKALINARTPHSDKISTQCTILHQRKSLKTCLRSSPRPTLTKRVTALPNDRPVCKVYAEPESDIDDRLIVESSRLQALKDVIPGGAALIDIAALFEEAALYILALQMQVQSLCALATMSTA